MSARAGASPAPALVAAFPRKNLMHALVVARKLDSKYIFMLYLRYLVFWGE